MTPTTMQTQVRLAALVGSAAALFATVCPGGEFTVRTIAREHAGGHVESFTLSNELVLRTSADSVTRIPAEDVVYLQREIENSHPSNEFATATLGRGREAERIVGTPVGFSDGRVMLRSPILGLVRVPLEDVALWVNTPSLGAITPGEMRTFVRAEAAGDDRVLLTNRDILAGIVLEIDSEGVVLETPDGQARLSHDRVAAVAIVGGDAPAADGVRARLDIVDGSRLMLTSMNWAGEGIKATALAGHSVRLPADDVVGLRILGGRWTSLADLQPSVEQTPMISVVWPYAVDRNVLGGPLRVGGRSFERGIGVHSRCALEFEIGGRYREFVTHFGLDDCAGALADVSVAVLADDVTRFSRDHVRPGELIGPIRLSVEGVDRLRLEVGFGRMGGIGDRFDWIEPGLIR